MTLRSSDGYFEEIRQLLYAAASLAGNACCRPGFAAAKAPLAAVVIVDGVLLALSLYPIIS